MSRDDVLAKEILDGFRTSKLDEQHKALCEWAEKLTLTPVKCTREDVEGLKAAGWSEEQIVSAAQIIGYFNHLNRLADGLGVDLEPEMKPE
ncbi:MAG: peroxidase [Planctomycetes bacterium]|nr:peroxidase [Planctomycetota bacterium]